MSASKRTSQVLALLIPAGVLGISSALATTQAMLEPATISPEPNAHTIADRLANIRKAVSTLTEPSSSVSEPKLMVAEWLNFNGGLGWHNGGWGNGGWGNGGWHNWGNGGWGNGGWHNWGNGGWHNAPNWGNGGWHNFWHNW